MPARRAWSILGLAALCAHCSLGVLLAGLSLLGFVTVPTVLGVDIDYVWPPVAIVGGFGLYLWSGRRRQEACAAPRLDVERDPR